MVMSSREELAAEAPALIHTHKSRYSTYTQIFFRDKKYFFRDMDTFLRKKNVSMSDTAMPSNIPWNQDRGHIAAIFMRIVVVRMLSSLFCLCVLLFV